MLRTALTGSHLLETGELVTDVTCLLDRHDLADARELVDRARDRSPLPEEPANFAEVEAWLVAYRLGSAAAHDSV